MGQELTYFVANAFISDEGGGNAAAVFLDAADISSVAMQKIATQLNFIETVFISLPSAATASFLFRYFSPQKELPIAGHPTIAALGVLDSLGKLGAGSPWLLETTAGIQKIERQTTGDKVSYFMEQPQAIFGPILHDVRRIAETFAVDERDLCLDLPIQVIDTGLGHLVFGVNRLDALMRVRRNIEPLQSLCADNGVAEAQIFCRETISPEMDFHTRNICPRDGDEDPACGVGNGALYAYLARCGLVAPGQTISVEQGHSVKRPSIILVTSTPKAEQILSIKVGGQVHVEALRVFHLI